jgi:hypothetical protein
MPPLIIPDSHHIRLAPAFAMAISPKSNPVRLSLEMLSGDLAGAPKNIIDKANRYVLKNKIDKCEGTMLGKTK